MARFAFLSVLGGESWGGSEELWAGAALRLKEAGHFVAASTFEWAEDVPKVDELARKGIIIHRRPIQPRWTDRVARKLFGIAVEKKTIRWLREMRPDLVIISQGEAFTGLEWMLICQEQGWRYAVIAQANWEGFWPQDSVAARVLTGYRGAAKAFFVSRNNLRLLSEQLGGDIAGAEIVSNPFMVPHAPAVAAVNASDVFRLACVARLEPKAKGQDLLFRVLSQQKWRARPVELRLYGKGGSEQSLRRLAASLGLGNVIFEGHVSDVEEIWRRNHALVLPSRFEGMPLALIEAMLCSRMAIVTDVGGNAELVEDGACGFVAKAPTAELLDEAMERAWERRDHWNRLGAAARQRAMACVPADPVGDFAGRLLKLAADA